MEVTTRREHLLEMALGYVLTHGLADLSLRPLAAALGTSDRMLLYHFGSKRALVEQVLDRASSHLAAMVLEEASLGAGLAAVNAAERLERLWVRLASAEAEPYLRLWFEAQGLALRGREPYASVAPRLLAAWLDLSASVLADLGLPTSQARRMATVEVAAVQGLLLDLLATADRERTDAGAHDVIERLVAWQEDGPPA